MDIRSKAGPINVFVIDQDHESVGSAPHIPHTTQDTSSHQVTQPQLMDTGRTMSEHNTNDSTEVTASITGSITTPKVIKQEMPSVASQNLLMSVQEVLEMSQEEGETLQLLSVTAIIVISWESNGLLPG